MLIGHEPWHSLSLPTSASSRLWFAFPKGMQGIVIVMVTAALLSLAFMGFSGVDGGLRALFGLK